jgi:hypothetical protein
MYFAWGEERRVAEYAPLTKLTGVWQKTSAKGVTYFVGRLGAAKLVILPNRDKKVDADPDFFVYAQERGESKPADDIPDPGEPARRQRSGRDL